MDVGAGNCRFAFEVSKHVKKVYAIEVSQEIAQYSSYPDNLELVIFNGCVIPVPANTVDLAYSRHVVEHLHPDDALEQLQNIYQALTPGGTFICLTPNRIFGPHDASKGFDRVSTGLHLKEYSTAELAKLLKTVGFSHIKFYVRFLGILMRLPLFPVKWDEFLLGKLPHSLRQVIGRWSLFKQIATVRLIARK